jgi:hypothetical protein
MLARESPAGARVIRDVSDDDRTILSYRGPLSDDRDRLRERWIIRGMLTCGAYPVVFLLALYALWAGEYVINCEHPIPPCYGPDNALMRFLYAAVAILFLGAIPVGCASWILLLLTAVPAKPPRGARRSILIGLAIWVLCLILWRWDPLGAWSFYID